MDMPHEHVEKLRRLEEHIVECVTRLDDLKQDTKRAREDYDEAITRLRGYVHNVVCPEDKTPLFAGGVDHQTGELE